jgi:hypothetical protein
MVLLQIMKHGCSTMRNIVVAAKEFMNDRVGADRMDEILEAIRPEFDLDTEDPPTSEVE